MFSAESLGLPRRLSANLILTCASTPRELEAVAACHAATFGQHELAAILANLRDYPGSVPQQVLYIEDTQTGQPVSSINLTLETWTYEGIPLRIGEVAVVSTLEAYRKQGLIREQFRVCHQMAREAGCLLSIIAGIPYYYRQFGYEYILPLDGGWNLRPDQVPDLSGDQISPYRLRPANAQDMPTLMRFHAEATRDFCVAGTLTEDVWRYQDSLPEGCSDRKMTFLLERNGEPAGYMRLMAHENDIEGPWHKGLQIKEAYLPRRDDCLAALRFARKMTLEERQLQMIKVHIPVSIPFTPMVKELGGEWQRPYAWQVRVLDRVRFLQGIAPILEKRLAASPFAGLTQDFGMGLYDEVLVLQFREGRLQAVISTPEAERHLTCSPTVFPMIWLGYRSVDEVLLWYPDALRKDTASQELGQVLFPKRDSWVVTLF